MESLVLRQHRTPAKLEDRLRLLRHVALDLDGTIYHGGRIFEFTHPFLTLLEGLGIGHSFLTNNSSKSGQDYVEHLRRMGIAAEPDQVYTSTLASLEYLSEELPGVRRLFVLGTASMRHEIAAAGFTVTQDDPRDEPDAVLVGFDMELTYARLCRAAHWIQSGKAFLASHPDRVCPTDQPTVLPDCGAICAALREATGRSPDAVLGKPDPRMLRGLLHQRKLTPERLAMVGDRLSTDIEMARRAGVLGVLVLTGEATSEDAARFEPPPDLVVHSLEDFGRRLRDAFASASTGP